MKHCTTMYNIAYTVVGDFINTKNTQKHISQKKLSIKSFSMITCKLVIRKKLVYNRNLNKKVVFIVFI